MWGCLQEVTNGDNDDEPWRTSSDAYSNATVKKSIAAPCPLEAPNSESPTTMNKTGYPNPQQRKQCRRKNDAM